MENKYIIFQGLYPVIFSGAQKHSDVAAGYLGKATSAGFFRTRIEDGKIKVSCYGESISLKLKSDKKDNIYLEMLLNQREDW